MEALTLCFAFLALDLFFGLEAARESKKVEEAEEEVEGEGAEDIVLITT